MATQSAFDEMTNGQARLLFIGAQGLLDPPRRRVGADGVQTLIESLGFVQIDSINVLERAHHLTLRTRLDSYQHEHLKTLLETDRSLFEHWTHDASAIPSKWFPQWNARFEMFSESIRKNRWWNLRIGEQPDRTIDEVRERIAAEGPLRSSDFEHESDAVKTSWWGWKPQKAALEYLWSTGELMIARREGFQKIYDLTERVLPNESRIEAPTPEANLEWACTSALNRLGVATVREISGFWDAITTESASAWCQSNLSAGRIVRVMVNPFPDGKPTASFAFSDWRERLSDLPAAPERIRLMCPFDPVIRDRARLKRLFGFEYRFEAYVPLNKRQFGYFVLPVMEGSRIIGRLDPKFDRNSLELRVKRLELEPGIKMTQTRRKRLLDALERLAGFVGAERVVHVQSGF